jgi:hypothetical protein
MNYTEKEIMPVTDKIYFSRENISLHKFDAAEALAEQAVHCLELVAELVQAGLSFQFKGGNSLLLILSAPQRFSIDVDIATDEPRDRIEQCLAKAIADYGTFTKWTGRQHKTKPWLPLSSYYCFFHSHYVGPDDAFVMLDAQLTRSPYKTRFAPICCTELFRSGLSAEIPFPSSMIGDKLLTLGPRTLGIPVGKGKEAQRLKHVFDVSLLLSTLPPLQEIRTSLFACLEHENRLQKKAVTVSALLSDTITYCQTVREFASKPVLNIAMDPALLENISGLDPFAGHLFSKKYGWEELKKDMARAALVMTAACRGHVGESEFNEVLKSDSVDPEYYWKKTGEWLNGQP